LIYPEGDRTAPPSGRMPEGGYFFDTIVRQAEIDDDNLNPEDNLEEFGLVSDDDLDHFKRSCLEAEKSGRGIVATFGGMAFGDIAMVPAPDLKYPKGIRDITEWYISTMTRADYIHEVFEKQSEIALKNLVKIYDAVGNLPDAVFICGTDFGTQTSQFCSTDSYEDMYAPYYRKITTWIHENTMRKTFKHSCGAVEPFMPHFIDSGFDIINPVQCLADGMEPAHLKNTYGKSLTFWGEGVDTQKTPLIGTGSIIKSAEEFPLSYRQAMDALEKNGASYLTGIVFQYPRKLEKLFFSALSKSDRTESIGILNNFFELLSQPHIRFKECRMSLIEFMIQLRCFTEDQGDANGRSLSENLLRDVMLHEDRLSLLSWVAKPLMDYLISRRIDLACMLLADTRMPVKEIAVKSGYNDVNYFGKVFKKQMGYSPREFRFKS